MKEQMEKVYDPGRVEARLYEQWEQAGAFHAEPDPNKEPYCIVMPPPNITGQLHMGHALDCTIQDVLTRFKRMQGYCALWLPGTDHASIATEVKIVEQMAKEGVSKDDVGREGFLQRAWAWYETYGGRIVEQLRKMGSSCDWQRLRFTMDEGCSKAVAEVFVKLYNEGLIYRGDRNINWCPECRTALSDAEVEYEEQDGCFWHIRYPAADGSGDVIVATTRPETMLGDTAVAVHPDDERYRHLVGKMLVLPLTGREIPVIADEYVSMDFGTGCVKITPSHDPNDFEVGLRHHLEMPRVIDDGGRMNALAGKYQGLDRYECRKQLVQDLEDQGYLVKVEPHVHNVGTCYRCHTTVEPILSKQWFVRMEELAKPAIEAVRNDTIRFVPERFDKIYFNWMENIRDWCISRQLWWGHRIPVYYCTKCGHAIAAKAMPTRCEACGHDAFVQDEDVLDTWFSSALWPFSTLGWPENTADLDYFYPTDVLVTAYDIIFFWVARMIFSGLKHMDREPFHTVMIHGIVRDAQGRKMSKSLGNGIDPLMVVEQYGADALRFSLSMGVAPGSDMRFSSEKVEACRNFANKIWNASRFVLMNLPEEGVPAFTLEACDIADQYILGKLNGLIQEVTDLLNKYELGLAAQKLYDFFWSDYCDWYIELAKVRLNGEGREQAQGVLLHVLKQALQLLHPFMPFLTEEIFSHLPGTEGFIMLSDWPQPLPGDFSAGRRMEEVMEIIRMVRNQRAEMNVPPSRKAALVLLPGEGWGDTLAEAQGYLMRLASASQVSFIADRADAPHPAISLIAAAAEAFLPMAELVDVEKERARMQKELKNLDQEIARAQGKLNNPGFTAKAPAQVVQQERDKLAQFLDLKEKTVARLQTLEQL